MSGVNNRSPLQQQNNFFTHERGSQIVASTSKDHSLENHHSHEKENLFCDETIIISDDEDDVPVVDDSHTESARKKMKLNSTESSVVSSQLQLSGSLADIETTMDAQSITFSDDVTLCSKIKIEHIKQIASCIPDWRLVAEEIGVGSLEIGDIDSRRFNQESNKGTEMLRRWIDAEGSAATYGKITKALEKLGEQGAAEKVCKIVGLLVPKQHLATPQYEDITSALKKYYVGNFDDTPIDHWPPVLNKMYINLALITMHYEKVHKYKLYQTIRGSIDDILESKETMSYEKLLQFIKTPGTRVLLEGRPGCGKTTLLKKLCKDWGNCCPQLASMRLFLFVPLRQYYSSPVDSIETILRKQGGITHPTLVHSLSSQDGEGVCLAIDGFDEYMFGPSDFKDNKWLRRLISGEELRKSVILITSRPTVSQPIRKIVSKRIEVLGFFKEQIMHYIDTARLQPDQRDELKHYLDVHANIRHMCYIPINLNMFVFLYDNAANLSLPPPKLEHEVYHSFTKMSLLRHFQKNNNSIEQLNDFCDLPAGELSAFRSICELAYQCCTNTQSVIPEKHISDVIASKQFLDLLNGEKIPTHNGIETLYSFLHLTQQEFLAAWHLSQQTPGIGEWINSPHMSVVMKFYCGITGLKNDDEWKIMSSNALLQNVSANKEMNVKTVNLQSLQCLFESQNKQRCKELMQLCEGDICITNENLTLLDYTSISFCLAAAADDVRCLTFLCDVTAEGLQIITSALENSPLSQMNTLTMKSNLSAPETLGAIENLVKNIPKLQQLNLNECHLGKCDPNIFCAVLKKTCNHLTRLCLIKNGINVAFAKKAFSEVAKHLTKLKHLDLSYNPIGATGATTLLSSGKNWKQLEFLHLRSNRIGGDGVAAICDAAKSWPLLKHLDLENNNIASYGFNSFCRSSHEWHQLQYLNVGGSKLGLAEIKVLSDSSKSWPNLKHLNVENNQLQQKGAEHLCEAAKDWPKLCYLYLGTNRILAAGVNALCKGHWPSLQVLGLDNNGIGRKGAESLSTAAKSLPRLEELSISRNLLVDSACDAVIGILRMFELLKKLKLSSNNFDSETQTKIFQAANTKTKVIFG